MDLIERQAAIDALRNIRAIKGSSDDEILLIDKAEAQTELMMLPSAQPEIVRCFDCKNSPLKTWFNCPLAHLPFDGNRWCWKGERDG